MVERDIQGFFLKGASIICISGFLQWSVPIHGVSEPGIHFYKLQSEPEVIFYLL